MVQIPKLFWPNEIFMKKLGYFCNQYIIKYTALITLSKIVVQTNLPSKVMIHIFRTGLKSTFTWDMPYKSISVLLIT